MDNNIKQADITPEQLESLIDGLTKGNFLEKAIKLGIPVVMDGDELICDPSKINLRSMLYLGAVYSRLCVPDKDDSLISDLSSILARYRAQYVFEEQCYLPDNLKNNNYGI